ncbi:hypothetical protein [Asticcacaulis sp. W401b]|uniref:hypothetical protein n=1 Tax=Asticcacaulis sp. W401b TaxID=3388666 RepID=UPI00397092FB
MNQTAIYKCIDASFAISMYDTLPLMTRGYYDKLDLAKRTAILWTRQSVAPMGSRNGLLGTYQSFLPDTHDGMLDPDLKTHFDLYRTPPRLTQAAAELKGRHHHHHAPAILKYAREK